MIVRVDFHDELPIYEQIVRQIVFAVAAGALRPGELVPSVRDLARQLTVNPNTVARAYRELQDWGVLVPVRGTGLAVAEGAEQLCRSRREQFVERRIRAALREALRSGLAENEVRRIVEQALRELAEPSRSASPGQKPESQA